MNTSEKKYLEDALLRALDFDNAVMANMAEGLYTVDENGIVTFVNPAAETLFGWSSTELCGKHMHAVTHYKHRDGTPFPADQCAGLAVLKKGTTLRNYEDVFIRKDGMPFDVVYSSSPIRKDGRTIGLVVVFRDVSDIKRAEEAAQHRAAVVESSADAIVTKTLEGTITSWNDSAQRIFGYTADEAIGRPITMLFPPNHINEEAEIIARIKRGERVNHYETVRMKKDGTPFPISLTISPIKNAQGKIVGASKIARDISAQKEYERKLLDQANDLEQFAYVASHDLQEPLRKVAIYTQLLVSRYKENATSETDKYINYITDAIKRMQALIKDVLNYSRANRVESIETVNLNKIIKDVMTDLEIPIRESKANITWDNLPTVEANPFQMHQLFQNLLSNAIKFRGEKAPQINVSAQPSENHVIIGVRDAGIGIEKKYHDQIFRVFQRLHTGAQYPGTGIGLAICKKIVEYNGGKIWLESEPQKGSTFFFSLKVAKNKTGEKRNEN